MKIPSTPELLTLVFSGSHLFFTDKYSLSCILFQLLDVFPQLQVLTALFPTQENFLIQKKFL